VLAILNPRAGVAARKALGALMRGVPGWEAITIEQTQARGHAYELARRAAERGLACVLAVGGDGTVNEVATGLLGSSTALGVVPVGSGNGLARTLGVPLEPHAALRALASAVTRRMDVGVLNGRPFLNVAGAGFDAVVGADFHRHGLAGGRRGIVTYLRLGLGRVFHYEAPTFVLETDAGRSAPHAFLVAFANGRQYGAGVVVAPRARLDDGEFDVIVIEACSVLEVLLNVPRLFAGRIERFRRFRRERTRQARLSSAQAFDFHRDGEPEAQVTRLDLSLAPRALRVRVPLRIAQDPHGPFEPQDARDS
jgi:YegS/Rv2252/BmrU family lipid kinase